ncbi:membrane protein insertase YidC [Telmatospirillum sp. J64-1]|uniref:membrane protein insertase YidC n=1 Tax=Telmatospirillum sp. J64-1 TaxID=2502183 RepID=UPI00115E6735|nr:membrane protein insertase YidC [Telmatospirillum sp. J64-1]
MTEQRNLILAIVLSIAIMLGFQLLFAPDQPPPQPETSEAAPDAVAPAPGSPVPLAPAQPQAPTVVDRQAALAQAERVRIDTPRLHGSINLHGGRLDDLTLIDYRETPDPNSPEIRLLNPVGSATPYFAEFGWTPADPSIPVPGPDTVWSAEGNMLRPDSPVVLTWDNGQGLIFVRRFEVDENYMFTITQTVENQGEAPVTLYPYGLASRVSRPATEGFFILHEGPIGVFNGTLREPSYSDLAEQGRIEHTSTGGWIGITDKYWLVALAPNQDEEVRATFSHRRPAGAEERFQFDYLGAGQQVAPGETITNTGRLFAGAKELDLLDGYSEQYGIDRFDLAIDFGWFYFMTKPFFQLLKIIYDAVGNFGIAILIITVLIKAILFPLANKSYKAMTKMKALQPELKKLQERFKDDKMRLNQEMMALYKREKVNPVSGCLPVLVQIPIFFALYKVLFVTIEMRHAPFFGWIQDLSAPDPTSIFNLFGLIPWDPPSFLMIGIWPLIMGFTMWLQQRLNPQPTDPIQVKMFQILPIVFTFLLATFPAGLVIYWAWSNSLSILQQWIIMRRAGVKI